MKKIQLFLAAIVAVVMSSCVNFKTEATVDVQVLTPEGKAAGAGVMVYKFNDSLGEGTTLYKSNNKGSAQTNAAGVAHFDLKSPEDLDPSNVAGLEVNDQATFYFCTYDSEDHRNGIVIVKVKTGDKKTVELHMENPSQGGED